MTPPTQDSPNSADGSVDARFQTALRHLQKRDVGKAESGLKNLIAEVPDHAGAFNALGLIAAQRGDRQQAEADWQQALTLAPDFAAPHTNLGELKRRHDPKAAYAHYRRALELDPKDLQAIRGITALMAAQGLVQDAGRLAEQGLSRHPDDAVLAVTAARGMIQTEGAEAALALLSRLPVHKLPDRTAQSVHYATAAALDRLGREKEALAAAAKGGAVLKRLFARQIEAAPEAMQEIRALASHYRDMPPPPSESGSVGAGHVFLLGFENAGAERLAQVLAGHPQVSMRPQTSALAAAMRHAFGAPTIPRPLTAATLEAARADYSARLGGAAPAGQLRIDFQSMALPVAGLAMEMFPAARFIEVRRDPRAACLAGILRDYEVTPTTAHLLDFENAAALHEAVMAGWEPLATRLGDRLLRIDHDRLLTDGAAVLTETLSFLGLKGQVSQQAVSLLRANPRPPVGDWARYRPHLPATALARLGEGIPD